MNIGFDVDGVLADVASFQLKNGEKHFAGRGIPLKDPRAFDVGGMFACTRMQRHLFWLKYIWRYCTSEPMTEGAAELSKRLKAEGHKITIVTARVFTDKDDLKGRLFRKMLRDWLDKNGFVYDQIFYCLESEGRSNKIDICLEQGVDIFIDDKPSNLYGLMDKIPVICYPAPWNEELSDLDPYRVKYMCEVYDRIHAVELKLTADEIAYLEEPYVPHPLAGVMAQNKAPAK